MRQHHLCANFHTNEMFNLYLAMSHESFNQICGLVSGSASFAQEHNQTQFILNRLVEFVIKTVAIGLVVSCTFQKCWAFLTEVN